MIRMFSASYKRPTLAITHKVVPDVTYVVEHKEAAAYRQLHPRVLAVPDGVQGNLPRVLNWILDQYPDDQVAVMDDDIKAFGRFQRETTVAFFKPSQFYAMLEEGCALAEGFGSKMWGINISDDSQNYRECAPFSLSSYIGGPFSCHMASPLRYDEDMLLKEDYDLTLQHLSLYRTITRLNCYYYNALQAGGLTGQTGGVAMYRSIERETAQNKKLQKKWGARIVRFDTSTSSRSHTSVKRRAIDINPILQVPIKGV